MMINLKTDGFMSYAATHFVYDFERDCGYFVTMIAEAKQLIKIQKGRIGNNFSPHWSL